jgi:hypothetical protein
VVFTQKTNEVMVRRTDGVVVQAGSIPVETSVRRGCLASRSIQQFGQGNNRTRSRTRVASPRGEANLRRYRLFQFAACPHGKPKASSVGRMAWTTRFQRVEAQKAATCARASV